MASGADFILLNGELIKNKRTELELTQAELAALVREATGNVYYWEGGSRRHPFDRALRIAKALGLTVDALSVKGQVSRCGPTPPTKKYNRTGTFVRHPGVVVQEYWIGPLGLTPREVADVIGLKVGRVKGFLAGEQPATPNLALLLQKHFGVDARVVMSLQMQRDLVDEERFGDD